MNEQNSVSWALAVAHEALDYFERDDQRDSSRALVILARELVFARSALAGVVGHGYCESHFPDSQDRVSKSAIVGVRAALKSIPNTSYTFRPIRTTRKGKK